VTIIDTKNQRKDGVFDVPVGKQKTCQPAIHDGLLVRLEVLVARLPPCLRRQGELASTLFRRDTYDLRRYLLYEHHSVLVRTG